jgi:hypothetical protein
MTMGDAPSRPTRTMSAVVDATPVTSYATGGFTDAILSAQLEKFGVDGYFSVPMAATNATTVRWFAVNPANHKVKAYSDDGVTEVAAATNLSLYTAIPVRVFGEG